MTRRYLGVSPEGITVYRNVRKDGTGKPLLLMDRNETTKLALNFADYLESGETISSVTTSTDGCSVSASTSSSTITLTISSPTLDGGVTVKVTMSGGEIWEREIVVREIVREGDEVTVLSDYI